MLAAGSPDSLQDNKGNSIKKLEIPWFPSVSSINISVKRKEISRERKRKFIFNNSHVNRFKKLVTSCADKLGTDATIKIFGKLGRETGIKEYNALIGVYIRNARTSIDLEVALEQIGKAFELLKLMKEQGFQIGDTTYGPLLMYLIDMGMIEEFQAFCEFIKDGTSGCLPRLGYYEMLLWIEVDNEQKIQELCNCIGSDIGEDISNLEENYLVALCEKDRKRDLLPLLDVIDITKIKSQDHVASIFKSLGRLSLKSSAKKFLLSLKNSGADVENISNLIFCYVTSIPNLAVEGVASEFKNLHEKLEVTPAPTSYEKLITYSCVLLKVHVALDIIDQMCEAGLTLSIDMLHSILHASEQSYDFNLVRQIRSIISQHDLKPTSETFRSMISLSVKMKDFEGAYSMLCDMKEMNLTPTACMYNAIMAGYFREKNIKSGLMVLKQMELEDIKPDSQTFSYLINNCDREEDVVKYYEELKHSGLSLTKQVFMSLINGYAACGQFEKAKEVILDKGIPVKSLNEIKSVLVSALAANGQMSGALNIYEEIKQAGFTPEPKAIIYLIENLQSEGQLGRLLQLLEELNDPDYWIDGCCRVILYCIRHKHLSSAIDLLRKLNEKRCDNELAMEVLFDEVFSLVAETEPVDLEIGLDLLRFVKDDLGLSPSRKCLDFLLNACVNAKDLQNSLFIWKEYKRAHLPYNILSFLRMYQALLASGDHKSAKILLSKIPRDDPHVRSIVGACKATYKREKKIEEQKLDRTFICNKE